MLSSLFASHGSDKDRNGYSSLYNALFLPLKDAPVSLLEVGIGTMIPGAHSSMKGYMPDDYRPGASLRAWKDFFQNGQIHGMDVQADCMLSEERIATHLCDSTDPASVLAWTQANPDLTFDVVIDDGSHWDLHQLATLKHLWPLVKPGGYYVIEDVTADSLVSREPLRVHEIVGDVGIFFAGLKNNLCVIHKAPLQCCREHF
jgi:demethylmacrocin O-methyltransferase